MLMESFMLLKNKVCVFVDGLVSNFEKVWR